MNFVEAFTHFMNPTVREQINRLTIRYSFLRSELEKSHYLYRNLEAKLKDKNE